MPIQRPEILSEEIYHIFNRGVEKRNIFMRRNDYLRFIISLFVFNDKQPVNIFDEYSRLKNKLDTLDLIQRIRKRKQLVEILAFCLMPNHFHLLLQPLLDNGIALFMQKLSAGYTGYFNKKYERVGSLFQGTYKMKQVKDQRYGFFYVHSNPIELVEPNWREEGVKNFKEVIDFLENYKWSSYVNYLGKDNFPAVINKKFFEEIFDGVKDIEQFMKNGMIEDYNYKKVDCALD